MKTKNVFYTLIVFQTIKHLCVMGNEYLVATDARTLCTGVHRLIVQNPDSSLDVASWHGVLLNVHMWRPTPRGFSVSTTLAKFPVMLDGETPKPTDFLWQLLTARLPFNQWACVTLTMDKTTDDYYQKNPTSQIWPEVVKEYFGPRDRRQYRIVNTIAHEFAARSGLETVQDIAWGVTRHSKRDVPVTRTMKGQRDRSWAINTHSEEWTLDIRAKQAVSDFPFLNRST